MKRGKRLILPLLGTLILTSLFSCGVDRWPEYYPETGRDIWIDSVMRQEYLWYEICHHLLLRTIFRNRKRF